MTTETLPCGCQLTQRGAIAHLYPCSAAHKTVAAYARNPGDPLVVHAVKKEES